MSKSQAVEVQPIIEFLGSETPKAWIECALKNQDILLIDHANCEKKAASTALNLMYRYVDFPQLLQKLSRLAREELRHFEQVHAIMRKRNIDYPQLNASRYAGGLRDQVSKHEPMRLVDTLIVGAIIEARSCERFAALAPHLDKELSEFYGSLLKSESRHFMDYLALARQVADEAQVAHRTEALLRVENALIADPDPEFRFHSGVPLAV